MLLSSRTLGPSLGSPSVPVRHKESVRKMKSPKENERKKINHRRANGENEPIIAFQQDQNRKVHFHRSFGATQAPKI
jgi:hypothetical protein